MHKLTSAIVKCANLMELKKILLQAKNTVFLCRKHRCAPITYLPLYFLSCQSLYYLSISQAAFLHLRRESTQDKIVFLKECSFSVRKRAVDYLELVTGQHKEQKNSAFSTLHTLFYFLTFKLAVFSQRRS